MKENLARLKKRRTALSSNPQLRRPRQSRKDLKGRQLLRNSFRKGSAESLIAKNKTEKHSSSAIYVRMHITGFVAITVRSRYKMGLCVINANLSILVRRISELTLTLTPSQNPLWITILVLSALKKIMI